MVKTLGKTYHGPDRFEEEGECIGVRRIVRVRYFDPLVQHMKFVVNREANSYCQTLSNLDFSRCLSSVVWKGQTCEKNHGMTDPSLLICFLVNVASQHVW